MGVHLTTKLVYHSVGAPLCVNWWGFGPPQCLSKFVGCLSNCSSNQNKRNGNEKTNSYQNGVAEGRYLSLMSIWIEKKSIEVTSSRNCNETIRNVCLEHSAQFSLCRK